MTTKLKIWVLLTGALAIATILVAIRPIYIQGVIYGIWQPLNRPPNVSAKAHYVSWIEDGNWFDCSVDHERNVDVCKAWDSNGRPMADGDFRLDGENRAANESELRPSDVDVSDGRTYAIYLFGKQGARSKTLIPINPTALLLNNGGHGV